MKTSKHFISYLAQFFLEWETLQMKVVEKIKPRIFSSVTFFSKIVPFMREMGGPQMTIWRMRMACWIPKTKNTSSGYVMLTAFPLQQWLCERSSVLRYSYMASLVLKETFVAGRPATTSKVMFRLREHLVSTSFPEMVYADWYLSQPSSWSDTWEHHKVTRPLPNLFSQNSHHSKLYNLCRWRNAIKNPTTQKGEARYCY